MKKSGCTASKFLGFREARVDASPDVRIPASATMRVKNRFKPVCPRPSHDRPRAATPSGCAPPAEPDIEGTDDVFTLPGSDGIVLVSRQ